MPEEVVCNTTPVQYLHQAGVLDLLRELYGRVLVPGAVASEIAAGMEAGVPLPDLGGVSWIEIREVTESPWPTPRNIHRGEAEVIALAGTLPGSLMILDDLAARRYADLLGLRFTGTLGVLYKARQRGLVTALRPVVDTLRECGFRLAESTRNDFLKSVGEA
jgi:predicted nucleic acid-binding protein